MNAIFPSALFFAAVCYAAATPARLVEIPGTSYEQIDEVTGVPVTITLSRFLLAPAELTQSEFEEIMGYDPAFHKGPNLPVETVSWWEAIRYCNLRSLKEGLEPCYNLETGECDLHRNGYRLPTDAEWAHAAGDDKPAAGKIRELANLGSSNIQSAGQLLQDLQSTGTKPAGSYPPNRYGLYDMVGNVWEWCNDYFNPVATPRTMRGLARILRGGSFISTTSQWARGYRTSKEPDYRSRFTGFRLCRTLEPTPALPATHQDSYWFDVYNRPPAGFETSTGDLAPLVRPGGLAEWPARRQEIEAKWLRLIGAPEIAPPVPAVKRIDTIQNQTDTGELMYLQVEPDWWEKIYVMLPPGRPDHPLPVVIVPFYDVDTPAGRDLSGRTFAPHSTTAFAHAAVQNGYMAVAIRWFGESYGEWYSEAVANLKLRHPHSTGLGKWVWDAHRLLDYLYTRPDVDRQHIGIIGHSLGSKMALYAAAFDQRITAVVCSEGGIGLAFSNWDAYWYLGEAMPQAGSGIDHHELLGLIAPRPFLLIGGDEYDGDKSWYYVNAVRPIYAFYNRPHDIGYFNHHKGHTPTPEAVWRSMGWLAHFLGPQ